MSKLLMPRLSAIPALALLLCGCAAGDHSSAPPAAVPAALQVSPGQVLELRTHAVGVQIYVCEASHDDSTRFEWIFKAPEAQLFDRAGKPVASHFAGPTWRATDGSSIVGEVVARDIGPDPLAIPWLLLRARSNGGAGLLSRTLSVQRLDTVGGKAPAGGCSAELAGSEARVHYTADYLFYRGR
ncbi:MAG: DUF3455 domain-containing protein [Steroidobacteraceae bacterium]